MNIFDNNLLDVADEAARIALEWEKEDDDFQQQHPESLIYKWFSQHSKTFKCIQATEEYDWYSMIPPKLSPLEVQTGRRHLLYKYKVPQYIFFYAAPLGCQKVISDPLPEHHDIWQKQKPPKELYSYPMSLHTYMFKTTESCFYLRIPTIIDLYGVTEWPDWFASFPGNVLFWLDRSCSTPPKATISNYVWCDDYGVIF